MDFSDSVLSKQNRLKKKKDFETVFKQGKGFKQNFLFLKVLKNNSDDKRFGFIVSQKVSKKAVVRNKIKRRLREIVRNQLNQIKKGIDVVIVALSGIEQQEFQEMKQTINKLFKKAGIISK